jgi:hypothetical protein
MPSIPNDDIDARLWAKFSPDARAALERRGLRPSTAPPAPPSSSSSTTETSPPPAPVNRRERRAFRALEQRKPAHQDTNDERKRRAEARDAAYLYRLRRRLERRGLPGDVAYGFFHFIPRTHWVMARDILADPSGEAVRVWFRRMRNKIAVGAIRAAALAPCADGTTLRTWSDERARRVAALGLAFVRLSVPTHRKGGWTGLVRGVPIAAFRALLTSPWEAGRRPSRTALTGTHRRLGDHRRGQAGYVNALEQCGLLYVQQLPADQCEAWEACGPSGYACNRYWVVTEHPFVPLSDARRRELMALHESGWDAVLERPRRSAPPPAVHGETPAICGTPPPS